MTLSCLAVFCVCVVSAMGFLVYREAGGIFRDAHAMPFRTQCLLDDVKNRAAVINDEDVEASSHGGVIASSTARRRR